MLPKKTPTSSTQSSSVPTQSTRGAASNSLARERTDAEKRAPFNAPRSSGGKRGGAQRNGGSSRGSASGGNARRSSGPRKDRYRPSGSRPRSSRPDSDRNESVIPIPPLKEGDIRIIPLGGVEEIGKNMTVFETTKDILIIDMGFEFVDAKTPGIDYILPNSKYLEERKDKIRGLVITHGHLDHIGGIPYIMDRIGNPPIYTRLLTSVMIQKRQAEFPHLPPLKIHIVEKDDRLKLGDMSVRFFAVSHAIPDSMGIIIDTPYGEIAHTGDLRVDNVDGVPTEDEKKVFSVFKGKKPLLLLTDSTNVENPGFSLAEAVVLKNIEEIISTTKGRLIIGTFASQLERIIKIIDAVERHGRKVVIEGRSMKTNVEVAIETGLLKAKEGTLISAEAMKDYPPSKIVAIVTGSQGEEFAALMRMGNKTHKHFQLNKTDTVLLSSSVIPGNESGVGRVKNAISRQGCKIIHYRISEIHASGHANYDEIKWIHDQIDAKFFIPIHGEHYMLYVHANLAKERGVPEENIVIPDNGSIIEIQEKGTKIVRLPAKAPSNVMMVDGFNVGDIQDVVIRDRQNLASDGIFLVVAVLDTNSGKLRKSPDIISRGFVFLKESQDLLRQARAITKKTIEDDAKGGRPIDFDNLKKDVTDNVGRFLFQKTNKRPMVIPVILGV